MLDRRTQIGTLGFVALLAALAAWLWSSTPNGTDPIFDAAAVVPATKPLEQRLDPPDATPGDVVVADAAEVAGKMPGPPRARAQAAVSTPPKEKERIDLDATIELDVLVVHREDNTVIDTPVAGAMVTVTGMRAEKRGDWFAYRGDSPVQVTDQKGRATLRLWKWIDVDLQTHAVSLSISHPDFAPSQSSSVEVGDEVQRFQLVRGGRVSLRAWLGEPGNVISEIEILVDRQSLATNADWVSSNGTWTTTRLAPGTRRLQVAAALGGRAYYSDAVDLLVRSGAAHELSLELRAGESLEAELSANVPRPVVDGRVLLAMQGHEISDIRATLHRQYETTVDASGHFVLHDLPRGRGYLWVVAKGWTTRLVMPDTAREAGITLGDATPEREAAALAGLGRDDVILPRVELPRAGPTLVVEMEPAGVVEIRVRDEQGVALSGVQCGISPNVVVPGVGSFLAPGRTWIAHSDHDGIARIDDVPPDPRQWVGVVSKEWRLRAKDRRRPVEVAVTSSQVSRIDLVVERNDPTER